jgi:hypothetical protein
VRAQHVREKLRKTLSSLSSFFNSYLPDLLQALATPSKDAQGNPGPSPMDSIQGALARAGAAAGNSSGLQSLMLQRNYKSQLADQAIKQRQLDLTAQNMQGEAALRNAQIPNLNSDIATRQNPPIKPKEEDWSVVPNITGPNGELVQLEKNSGQTRLVSSMPRLRPFASPKLCEDFRSTL